MRAWPLHLTDALRRLHRPLTDAVFGLLLLGVVIAAGWLAARHEVYLDWTANQSNSLSPQSLAILAGLDAPLRATVFIDPQAPLAKTIEQLLARYRRALPGFEVRFLDPQRFPEQARDARVSVAGQIMLEYRGRRETLNVIGERALSAAIARLRTARVPWVAVVEGHGERRAAGEGAADLGRFVQDLKERGYLVRGLDLSRVQEVPANTELVLVSNPEIPLFPGEAQRLVRYLEGGGNLLWLLDPGPLNGLEVLAEHLGIATLPGTLVDPKAAEFESETAAMAVIADFPADALAEGLSVPALLPGALAFETRTAPGWTLTTFLSTGPQSWNETGRVEGEVSRDEIVGEQAGPLPVILALTRPLPDGERSQRVLLAGDGDFLSNAQLGAFGNRALGENLLRWVIGGTDGFALPPDPNPAAGLTLTRDRRLLLGIAALVVLPGLFLTAGLAMRWTRSRG